MPTFAPYVGKDVVVVGGGDSAFDWALHLEPVAGSVTLVHRRDAFRAHQRTVEQVRASSVEIVTKAQVTAPARRRVRRRRGPGGGDHRRRGRARAAPAQAVVAALGFLADLGPLQQWGIEVSKRHIVVDASMRTNLPRVFAAGDVTEYAGKVRLIAVGFGEAATAVNNAAVAIDPSAHVLPGAQQRGHLGLLAASLVEEVAKQPSRDPVTGPAGRSGAGCLVTGARAPSSTPRIHRVLMGGTVSRPDRFPTAHRLSREIVASARRARR